jgi:hypothetical protein
MRNPIRVFGAVLASLGVAVTCVALRAEATEVQGPRPRLVSDLLAQSELAFVGMVEQIDYAFSEPSRPGANRIPHTFVRYRVEKLYAGEPPDGSVTLRFIGGFDPVKMRILTSTRTPEIDLGDRDLLFVRGNTTTICPLVGDLDGRLRLIDGRVYSEEGRSVRLGPNGLLRLGARHRLEAVETMTVQGRTFRMRTPDPKAPDGPGDAVAEEELIAVVLAAAQGLESPKGFVDADPSVPFAGPDTTAVPPPNAK